MASAPTPSANYIVLCNLPHGLTCQVGDKRIKLRGSANYIMPNKDRKFQGPKPEDVVFGATMNYVERDFWDKWVAQMTDKKNFPEGYPPITNGQITWDTNKGEVTLKRKDTESIKSGFEQLKPEEHGVKKDDSGGSNTSSIPRITE